MSAFPGVLISMAAAADAHPEPVESYQLRISSTATRWLDSARPEWRGWTAWDGRPVELVVKSVGPFDDWTDFAFVIQTERRLIRLLGNVAALIET